MNSPSSWSAETPLRVGVAGLGAVAQAVHLPLLARLAGTFEIAANHGAQRGLEIGGEAALAGP